MMINIEMVRKSFELTTPVSDLVVERFFTNLFADFPATRVHFLESDLVRTKAAIHHNLRSIISNLDKPEALSKFLLSLGERYLTTTIPEEHFEFFKLSFLKTLSHFIEASWTQELSDHWSALFTVVIQVMKQGATKSSEQTKQDQFVANTRNAVKQSIVESPTLGVETILLELPDDLKRSIRECVRSEIRRKIMAEAMECRNQELKEISQLSMDELLLRWAG